MLYHFIACVADALNLLYRTSDYTNGLDECVGRLQRRLYRLMLPENCNASEIRHGTLILRVKFWSRDYGFFLRGVAGGCLNPKGLFDPLCHLQIRSTPLTPLRSSLLV